MPARFARLWFVLLLLLGVCPMARAQLPTPTPTPAPVQMSLASPFAKTAKPLSLSARQGKWVPLAITLSNTGDPVTGKLEAQLGQSLANGATDYPPNVSTVNVDLPTTARKTVWLYVRLDRPYADQITVTLSGRGINVPSVRVPLDVPDPEQREVLIVSDSDIGLNDTLRALKTNALFRGGSPPTGYGATGKNPVLPFSFPKEAVPDRWIGLDGADLVVLGDFPHTALSPQQLDALRGYVLGGGTLVAMGGANAPRLAASPLKDLWPLVPTASVAASPAEVASLVASYVDSPQNGADRLGGSPVVVTRGRLAPGALRLGDAPSPLLYTSKDSGAGRVLFLAYDPSQPPFKGWSGQGKLWSELFARAAKINTLATVDNDFAATGLGAPPPGAFSSNPSNGISDQATNTLLDVVSKAPQLRMPPVSRIAWFLALYVFFLVPLNYAVLRLIDRRELAWVTIPVIVVAFSVWAYTEALSIRGRAILTRQMDIVQSSLGSGAGRVDTLFWLFSPRTTTYNLTSGGGDAAVSDFANQASGEQGAFSIVQPLDGSGFRLDDAPLRIWTDRAFAAQSVGDLGQGITLQGQTLRNGTKADLYGAVWVHDRRVVGLGTFKRGASLTLRPPTGSPLTADITGEIVRQAGLDKVFDASSNANGIPQAALAAALGGGFGKNNEGTLLIAWGQSSVAPISIGLDGAQGRAMTLYVFRVQNGLLTGALAPRQATTRPVSFDPITPGQTASQGGFKIYDCEVPAQGALTLRARGTGVSSYMTRLYAERHLAPTSATEKVAVEGWNPTTARWETLSATLRNDPSPAGGWNLSGAVPAAWVRRPANTLRVRVRLPNAGVNVSSLTVEG